MTATVTARRVVVVVALGLVAAGARAAVTPPVFEGTWIAIAGAALSLHGRWSAQAIPGRSDEMQGS